MTFEECCNTFAVAMKSCEVQHAQRVLTLTNPGLRPESKARLQAMRVIIDSCHKRIVVEEADTWAKAEFGGGANSCEKVRAISVKK